MVHKASVTCLGLGHVPGRHILGHMPGRVPRYVPQYILNRLYNIRHFSLKTFGLMHFTDMYIPAGSKFSSQTMIYRKC